MTIEYFTTDIRRNLFVNGANGLLRDKLKVKPTRTVSGPSLWAKTAVYAAASKSGLLKRGRKQRRPITFTLDKEFLAKPAASAAAPDAARPAESVLGGD